MLAKTEWNAAVSKTRRKAAQPSAVIFLHNNFLKLPLDFY